MGVREQVWGGVRGLLARGVRVRGGQGRVVARVKNWQKPLLAVVAVVVYEWGLNLYLLAVVAVVVYVQWVHRLNWDCVFRIKYPT